MSNHEEYVTYQQAVELKRLGFDWPCRTWYKQEGKFYDQGIPGNVNSSPRTQQIQPQSASAPSQAVAMRWMREVKVIDINIYTLFEIDCTGKSIKRRRLYKIDIFRKMRRVGIAHSNYPTYEAALSAGLDACLELIGKEEENA